jgi:AcrR family transcriptional regulator
MPRSTGQLEQIRKEKKKLIMDVALELFAKNGFHATSISQITKAAGISKGLVYNYFSSKQEILEEISRWAFDTIYSNFDADNDGILTKEEFIHFIRLTIRSTIDKKEFWKLYFALIFQPHILEDYTKKYEAKGWRIAGMLRKFIESQGSSDPDKDLFAISCLLKGMSLLLVTAPEFVPTANLEEDIIQSCFKLISKSS